MLLTEEQTNTRDEDIDMSEIPELSANFFAEAISTRPGESLIDKVQSSRRGTDLVHL